VEKVLATAMDMYSERRDNLKKAQEIAKLTGITPNSKHRASPTPAHVSPEADSKSGSESPDSASASASNTNQHSQKRRSTMMVPGAAQMPKRSNNTPKSLIQEEVKTVEKKAASYLSRTDDTVTESREKFFEINQENTIIEKMKKKIQELNCIVEPYSKEKSRMLQKISELHKVNDKVKGENGKIKQRIKEIITKRQEISKDLTSELFKVKIKK